MKNKDVCNTPIFIGESCWKIDEYQVFCVLKLIIIKKNSSQRSAGCSSSRIKLDQTIAQLSQTA